MKSADHKTFEEMVTTSFIEAYNSSCFTSNATMQERLLTYIVEEIEYPTEVDLAIDPQEQLQMREVEIALQAVRPTHAADEEYAPQLLAQVHEIVQRAN